MLCRATQDGQIIVKSPEKTWSTGRGNDNPLQYSYHENPMNSMKRQKDMTLEDEPPRSAGVHYATGEEQKIGSETMKRLSQSGYDAQLQLCLVVKVNSDAIKNNTA